MDFFILGQVIREARLHKRLTQVEAAQAAGLHPATVSSLERGQMPDIGVRKLNALLEVVGLELSIHPCGHIRTLDDIAKEFAQPALPQALAGKRVRKLRPRTGG